MDDQQGLRHRLARVCLDPGHVDYSYDPGFCGFMRRPIVLLALGPTRAPDGSLATMGRAFKDREPAITQPCEATLPAA